MHKDDPNVMDSNGKIEEDTEKLLKDDPEGKNEEDTKKKMKGDLKEKTEEDIKKMPKGDPRNPSKRQAHKLQNLLKSFSPCRYFKSTNGPCQTANGRGQKVPLQNY